MRRFRKDLERIYLENNSPARIFEFRDDFDRYAGLSVEISRLGVGEQGAAAELQAAAGRRITEAVAATWKRRNQRRLDAHRELARSEFFSHFITDADNPGVDTTLADLMQTIGDERFPSPDNNPQAEFGKPPAAAPVQRHILDRAA